MQRAHQCTLGIFVIGGMYLQNGVGLSGINYDTLSVAVLGLVSIIANHISSSHPFLKLCTMIY